LPLYGTWYLLYIWYTVGSTLYEAGLTVWLSNSGAALWLIGCVFRTEEDLT